VRLLFAFACAFALSACSGGDDRVLPLELPRDPYLGLRCVDVAPCDRIGIAVWVGRPMKSVSANIRGHSVVLHRTTRNGTGEYRRGLFWEGVFRDHEAARTAGDMSTRRRVEVHAVGRDGKQRSLYVNVWVSLGYG
jgi:hypothetical protein